MYTLCTLADMEVAIKAKCVHGERLSRAEAAQHMACTAYGRVVGERTLDRWANEGLVTRYKVGQLQWVRFDRDELTAMATGGRIGEPAVPFETRKRGPEVGKKLRASAKRRKCPKCRRKSALVGPVIGQPGGRRCRHSDCDYREG